MRRLWLLALFVGGCALPAQHEADAAFRRAITAHVAGDESGAESEYRRILALGLPSSAVYNNLAVILVHRRQYISARRLFGRAVRADARDVVALTNYGVMSYWLADLREAERSLEDARALRREILIRIPSLGRADWESERWGRATRPLDETAARYLEKIARVERGERARAEPDELRISLKLDGARSFW